MLYAKWIINTYTISYDSQSGSAVAAQTTNYGALTTEPIAPTRSGYAFGGWYKEPECTTAWVFASDTITTNVTLFAKWIINYTVAFDPQGGSPVPSQSITSGTLATEPAPPIRTGYTFGGWYKEPECTTVWVFESDTITNNVTLFAKWIINYTVTFDSQGGSPVPSQSITSGTLATEPVPPIRTGYAFSGWYKESGCTTAWVFGSEIITNNVTIYAKWIVTYTVMFDSQGGSAVTTQTINSGALVTKPTEPTRIGLYRFVGWYKESSCTTAWIFGSDIVTANITLYAKWMVPHFWNSITSSSDGIKLAAVVGGGQIYTSTDSGITWTARDSNRSWRSIASSSDGTKLVAVEQDGQIYTSTDSGITWIARDSNRQWYSITSSSDGTKLAAVVWGCQIYTSIDSGITWVARDSNRDWNSITSSSDGTKLAALESWGRIYTSTDSGVTWTARDLSRRWRSIACSSDGTKLAAVDDGGQIYTSTDSGVTWTARDSNREWQFITSSSEGTNLAELVFWADLHFYGFWDYLERHKIHQA